MRKDELGRYRRLLLDIRANLLGDVNSLTDGVLNHDGKEAAGASHMAELGTDNFEHEFSFSLLENEENKLGKIDAALSRIEGGSFGACETCNCTIPKERLRAIPWTTNCVECAREAEEST